MDSPDIGVPSKLAKRAKIRLAVLGLALEANTFSPYKADLARVQSAGGTVRFADIPAQYGQARTVIAGYLSPGPPRSVELVPLVMTQCEAMGEFTAGAFESLMSEMIDALATHGPFDGVLLELHGAAVAEHKSHADAEIATRVRNAVGPAIPIGAVLDMHANIDQQLVDVVDVLRVFNTNPHLDAKERGLEVRERILEIIEGELAAAIALEPLPLVVNIVRQDTSQLPLRAVLDRCHELERSPGVLDVSVALGFPYADVEQMGMSVLVSHSSGQSAARAVASEVGAMIWQLRGELQARDFVSIEEALHLVADRADGPPLLLLDVGDNIGGGGSGDSTAILNKAVESGIGRIAFMINDPIAVAALEHLTVGDDAWVRVGGRRAPQAGVPQLLAATIVGRSDGRFEDTQPNHDGYRYFDMGPMVALRTANNIAVVLTSRLMGGNSSPAQLRAAGIEPTDYAAIVAKGVISPKAGYSSVCGAQIMVDTPGVTRLSVERFPYTRRRRPMYPFEPDAAYGDLP